MSALEDRISKTLGRKAVMESLADAMLLFSKDREGFYLLACSSPENEAPFVSALREATSMIRKMLDEGYVIGQTGASKVVRSSSGLEFKIPQGAEEGVLEFLRELDGKRISASRGRDYEGTEASEAEINFKLGADRHRWAEESARLDATRKNTPMVLKLSDGDVAHLAWQPPYVAHQLINCARRTVLSPTVVYRGLNRGEGAPSTLTNGWAFCGKPRQSYGNDGKAVQPPPGMVFVVFADVDGYVFDWDWVAEDPYSPGVPLDQNIRFDKSFDAQMDAVLDVHREVTPGSFDPKQASYSVRGDCIFCYIREDNSFAERVNVDLTVFRAMHDKSITGFKIKNVLRILRLDKSIVIKGAPDITVSVDSALLATLKINRDADVSFYSVLIRALFDAVGEEAPRVRLPNPSAEVVANA